jgi:hypothetical protein
MRGPYVGVSLNVPIETRYTTAMKIVAVLMFVCMTTLSLAQEQIGRYQVIVLKVPTGPSAELNVLKLDTVTGQTWKFVDLSVPVPPAKQTENLKKVDAKAGC